MITDFFEMIETFMTTNPLGLVASVVMVLVGLKILFAPFPSYGLRNVVESVAQLYGISVDSVLTHENEQAAELAIYFLRSHGPTTLRGLAKEFRYKKDDIPRIVRKMEWQVQADKTLQLYMEQIESNFPSSKK